MKKNENKNIARYTWVMDNFASSTSSTNFYFMSPSFCSPNRPGVQFTLYHYTNTSDAHHFSHYTIMDQSLFVLRATYDRSDLIVANRDELTVKFRISLIDANQMMRNTSG